MSGFVYLIHFASPISPGRHTAQHYIGYAEDWRARLEEHRAGQGARLTQVAVERGIQFDVVCVWPAARDFERYLKRRKSAPRFCPRCGGLSRLVRQSLEEHTAMCDTTEEIIDLAMELWYNGDASSWGEAVELANSLQEELFFEAIEWNIAALRQGGTR